MIEAKVPEERVPRMDDIHRGLDSFIIAALIIRGKKDLFFGFLDVRKIGFAQPQPAGALAFLKQL
jgi:hypothetical protein